MRNMKIFNELLQQKIFNELLILVSGGFAKLSGSRSFAPSQVANASLWMTG
jgi:hypothetical protein